MRGASTIQGWKTFRSSPSRYSLIRPGIPRGYDLRWVLLPFRLLKLGLSERLNSCQRPIPQSFDGEPLRS